MKQLIKKLWFVSVLLLLLSSCWWVDKDIDDAFYGSKDAKVQMVEYFDFQCPACISFNEFIWKELYDKYVKTNIIGFTYKNYPLSFHINAVWDAEAWLCAHNQWAFKVFADAMYAFEFKKQWSVVSKEERIGVAKELWLDTTVFEQCIDERWYRKKVLRDMQDWNKAEISGTPTIIINDRKINYNTKEEFFTILDTLIKN